MNRIVKDFNIKDEHQRDFIRLLDKVQACDNKNISTNTDFLDPYIAAKAKELMTYRYGYMNFKFDGGYDGAERQLLYLGADYEDMDYVHIPISVLKINRPKKFNNITHRDVMGSVLSLGIVRDKLGDIIIDDDLIQIIVMEDIVDYVRFNLDKVKNISVSPEIIDICELKVTEPEFKIVTGTVKTLRADAVISLGFNVSRSSASDDIKREKVKVNHIPINSPSVTIKDGDLISYRGKGRVIFSKAFGTTKKDRIRVEIKKYL